MPRGWIVTVLVLGGVSGVLRAAGSSAVTVSAASAQSQQKPRETLAYGISNAGQIVGLFSDASGAVDGFLRSPTGTVTLISPVGTIVQIMAYGINDAGQIVGKFVDKTGPQGLIKVHGFLRAPGGAFIVIDVPGATDTELTGINDAGQIVGTYGDAQYLRHGFLRTPGGTLITINPPGRTRPDADIEVSGINKDGQIVGFLDNTGIDPHGFLRAATGTFTMIDVPGAHGTELTGINDGGEIVGSLRESPGQLFYRVGFVRTFSGTVTTFAVPGATGTLGHSVGDFTGTEATGINNAGQIVGYFTDAHGASHGFLRGSTGTFTTIDAREK